MFRRTSNKHFFKDKNVLITGASSGLGAALAEELAKNSCKNIVLIARKKDKLDKVAEAVGEYGANAIPYACDVTQKKSVVELYQQIKKEIGFIDIAFLNAGIGSNTLAQNIDSSEIERVFQTNFFGVVYWLENLLVEMQRENRGLIVITSSLAAYRGLPGCGSYCASKAALSSLIESYNIDLLATNIKLVPVFPYFIETKMAGVSHNRNRYLWSSSSQAAQYILTGIARGKSSIVFPFIFLLFMYIMKIIPLSLYRAFWSIARRGG